MRKVGNNTYMDDSYQLYHLVDGEYKPFSLMAEAYENAIASAKTMSRVGVNFTTEQRAQIEKMVADEETAKAQRLILDELKKQDTD